VQFPSGRRWAVEPRVLDGTTAGFQHWKLEGQHQQPASLEFFRGPGDVNVTRANETSNVEGVYWYSIDKLQIHM